MEDINPAFTRNKEIATIVGKLVLSYGEIELVIAQCLGLVLGSLDAGRKTLFRISGESNRIWVAEALMRAPYIAKGQREPLADFIGAIRWCLRIRNQYAHVYWADDQTGAEPGLFFAELTTPAKAAESFNYWFRHLDLLLVQEQEAYFAYAMRCSEFLQGEYQVAIGKISGHPFEAPPKRKRPNLHNPPERHIPPWLMPEERQRHIERALAAKMNDRSLEDE